MTRNFDALYAYNAAELFLQSPTWPTACVGRALVTPWQPMMLACRARSCETKLLLARGHDIGEPDGMIGARTRGRSSGCRASSGWWRMVGPGRC